MVIKEHHLSIDSIIKWIFNEHHLTIDTLFKRVLSEHHLTIIKLVDNKNHLIIISEVKYTDYHYVCSQGTSSQYVLIISLTW